MPTRLHIPTLIALLLLVIAGCRTTPKTRANERSLTPADHLALGVAHDKSGNYKEALRHFSYPAQRDMPNAWFFMGNVYTKQHDLNKAEKAYKRAIKLNPYFAEAHHGLAWLYYSETTKLDKAEEHCRRAIDLAPRYAATYRRTLAAILSLTDPED